MKHLQADDQLINKLMDETFGESGSKDVSNESGDLLSYFNTKNHKALINRSSQIEDSFKRRKVVYMKAEIRTSGSILRFEVNGEKLDFPKNWSLLKSLTMGSGNRLYRSGVEINEDNQLFDVLSNFIGGPKEMAFLKYQGEIYLVHTKQGADDSLEWLDNYILEEDFFRKAA